MKFDFSSLERSIIKEETGIQAGSGIDGTAQECFPLPAVADVSESYAFIVL